jgi:hypothetical protein
MIVLLRYCDVNFMILYGKSSAPDGGVRRRVVKHVTKNQGKLNGLRSESPGIRPLFIIKSVNCNPLN